MKKTLGIRLSDEQLKYIKKIATEEERSLSAIIRRMIDAEIKKSNPNTKRS
ncbi:MAG: ribbon-helix-helix protein, CopG family [Candidatus Tenebribacter davisii]|nr:ribbon-helix-helix protein, CopG family [Candidatus Tenebribacter davisii]